MSRSEGRKNPSRKAVALQYGAGDDAPVVVASGMGYMAERIVEVAADNGVPIYEDNSLATILTQMQLGQEIPPELYQAVVEIYLYFLKFDPENKDKSGQEAATVFAANAEQSEEPQQRGEQPDDGSEHEE